MAFKDRIDAPPTDTAAKERPPRLFHRLRDGQPPLYKIGEDPDYRFSLANERTFLAWIRTALALLGAAIAVIQFVPRLGITGGRELLALLLLSLSLLISLTAYGNWANHERAMRLGEKLPAKSKLIWNVAVGLSIASAIVLVLMLILISKKG